MNKLFLFAASSLALSGCSSIPENVTFSEGAELMAATNLSNKAELYKTAQELQKHDLKEEKSTGGSTSDLLIGSGLAGSAIFYMDTGMWAGPGNFSSGMALTSFVLDSMSGKGMAHHKWTYTYFFHIDSDCESTDCVNENLGEFWMSVADKYESTGLAAENNLSDFSYSGAGFIFDYFEGEAQQTSVLSDGSPSTITRNLMIIRQLDDIAEFNGMEVWGNDTPKDYQDRISLPGMNYADETNLLIEASEGHPAVYIFRGVDREAAAARKPCFGGFFINNGNIINVPELGCML